LQLAKVARAFLQNALRAVAHKDWQNKNPGIPEFFVFIS